MNTYEIRHAHTSDLLGVIEAADALHALSAYSVGTGFSTYDHEGTADMVYENTPEKAAATYLNYAITATLVNGPRLVVTYDLTGFTPEEAQNLAFQAEVQGEREKGDVADGGHPSAQTKAEFFGIDILEKPRTILVHLNVEVPGDAPCDVNDIVREINGALAVGIDAEETPSLTVAEIVVALAEEI
jgi:hypothetical protein